MAPNTLPSAQPLQHPKGAAEPEGLAAAEGVACFGAAAQAEFAPEAVVKLQGGDAADGWRYLVTWRRTSRGDPEVHPMCRFYVAIWPLEAVWPLEALWSLEALWCLF
jgi:hypothetical protein